MAQRVTFYIDGFNFYYGLRRTKRNEPQWGDYYWIDMVKLCQGFLGEGQEVEKWAVQSLTGDMDEGLRFSMCLLTQR